METQSKELKMAYIAGFFDGEGCVQAYLKPKGSLTVEINIMNSYSALLDECPNIFGVGKVYPIKQKSGSDKKRLYAYRVFSEDGVRKVLEVLTPYLIEKRPQAEALLHYLRLSSPTKEDKEFTASHLARLKRYGKPSFSSSYR